MLGVHTTRKRPTRRPLCRDILGIFWIRSRISTDLTALFTCDLIGLDDGVLRSPQLMPYPMILGYARGSIVNGD